MSLVDPLRAAAERHPERPALTELASGRSLAYGALAVEVERIAAALRRDGVGPATRVGLVGATSLAYVPVAFGILAAGGCLVPLAANLRPAEQAEILAAIGVQALVRVPDDGTPWTFAWHDRDAAAPAGFAALDPAFVRFSSGTTAAAKGVVLSHRATLARIAAADAVLALGPEDRVVWTLPFAYHFAVTIPAYLGAGVHVLLAAETAPAATAAVLAAERATVLYASPVLLARLAAAPTARPLPALRLALSTAAPLCADVAERFAAVFGRPLGQAYGIIEAGLPCINPGGDPTVPWSSVGRPVPGYEVAILDQDGRRLRAGDRGEVALRGPGLFDAYYAPWTPRAATLRDGWFPTGDVGSLDPTGVLTLHGRLKSTIVVAGLKLFPEEVEAVLADFPAVAEARVFGRPHARLGELPYAEVVLHPSAAFDRAALARHAAARLSPWKVPVEITPVAAIAKAPGGKILRR